MTYKQFNSHFNRMSICERLIIQIRTMAADADCWAYEYIWWIYLYINVDINVFLVYLCSMHYIISFNAFACWPLPEYVCIKIWMCIVCTRERARALKDARIMSSLVGLPLRAIFRHTCLGCSCALVVHIYIVRPANLTVGQEVCAMCSWRTF